MSRDPDEPSPQRRRLGHRSCRRRARIRVSLLFLCCAVAFLWAGLRWGGTEAALLKVPTSLLPRWKTPSTATSTRTTEKLVALDPDAGLPPSALYAGSRSVAVLMYHDVTEKPLVDFDLTPKQLKQQFTQLKAAGAKVIPLSDLYDHLRTGKELPPKAVVLTFDDGYLGQYQQAYPLLKQFRFPASFFVHTAAVGVVTGKPHMSWSQLQALDREGLVRVESHTVTHPEDLRVLPDSRLETELRQSKTTLEEKLGRPMRFLAYPVGNADIRVARAARTDGYEMALTMGPGWAEAPADAYFVPRFAPGRVEEICKALRSDPQPRRIFRPTVLDLQSRHIAGGKLEDGQVRLRWVGGGRLSTVQVLGRLTVPAMAQMGGAAAGLNGTFFSDATVNSVGAGIVGPVMARFGPGFAPGFSGDRERLTGRPFVLIAPDKIGFLPFTRQLARDYNEVERLLPGATDCFLAGAWLVHQSQPLTEEELERFHLTNVFDYRPRAFLGVDHLGRVVLGASSTGNRSDRLAQSLVKLGLRECVLLDSGFSTSLVSEGAVLVSGIKRKDMEARPVPHALLLHPVNPRTCQEYAFVHKPGPRFFGPPYLPDLATLQERLVQRAKEEVARAEAAQEPLLAGSTQATPAGTGRFQRGRGRIARARLGGRLLASRRLFRSSIRRGSWRSGRR